MTQLHSLNNVSLAKESLRQLSENGSILHRAAHILDLVAHNSVGLGEVLQDFAHQSRTQLVELIRSANHAANGTLSLEEVDVLKNIHMILKTTSKVLEMTPVAMQRNKAESIGEKDKEKITRADVQALSEEFAQSPDVTRLLAGEDSGQVLLEALSQGQSAEALITPQQTDVFLQTSVKH